MTEIAALKAKLAAAEANNVTLGAACDNLKAAQKLVEHNFKAVAKERDEARSEAAALREALTFYADYASWTASKVDYAGVGTPGPAYSDTGRKARKTISQPGPGAAYQERLRETESKFATQTHNLNVMNERVKKLEAVAEAVVECRNIDRIVMGDIMTPTVINMSPFKRLEDALAALEEKP